MITGQKRTRVASPSLKRRLRLKNVGEVDVFVTNISPLSLPALLLLIVLLLLLSSSFSLPVSGGDGLLL